MISILQSRVRVVRVLLADSSPASSYAITKALSRDENHLFRIRHTRRLSTTIEAVASFKPSVILLDLNLPDCRGFRTFTELQKHAPDIPVVIKNGQPDSEAGVESVRLGAQDYICNRMLQAHELTRSLLYAIERHRNQMRIQELSMEDELTGLYNRRGLMRLGIKHLRLAKRLRKRIRVMFIDLDGLKRINDTFGHRAGDLALEKTAEILRKNLRESDIIARLGGDEFAVISISDEETEDESGLKARLGRAVFRENAHRRMPFILEWSIGLQTMDADKIFSIEQLLDHVDRNLYEQKKKKQMAHSN